MRSVRDAARGGTPPSAGDAGPPSGATRRAPALYVTTRASGTHEAVTFRLPLPPAGVTTGAWAGERRARNAYFAALDALRSGQVRAEEPGKVLRLAAEVGAPAGRAALRHLARVLYAARAAGAPLLGPTGRTARRVEIVVRPAPPGATPSELARRYAWAYEWLRTRGLVAARPADVGWRARATPVAGVRAVPEAPPRARPGER